MGYYLTEPMTDTASKTKPVCPPRLIGQTPIGAPFWNTILSTKYWDSDTKTMAYQLRDYGPGIGRWLSKDPVGEAGGIGVYSYGQNSPLTRHDSLGLCTAECEVGKKKKEYANCKLEGTKPTGKPCSPQIIKAYEGNTVSFAYLCLCQWRGAKMCTPKYYECKQTGFCTGWNLCEGKKYPIQAHWFLTSEGAREKLEDVDTCKQEWSEARGPYHGQIKDILIEQEIEILNNKCSSTCASLEGVLPDVPLAGPPPGAY